MVAGTVERGFWREQCEKIQITHLASTVTEPYSTCTTSNGYSCTYCTVTVTVLVTVTVTETKPFIIF